MIEKLNSSHYTVLMEIWQSAVLATHDFLAREDFLYYQKNIPSYFEFVTLYGFFNEDKQLVGFIGIAKENIEMLFVSRENFAKGIGKALINYAVDHHQVNFVDVNQQNNNAVDFYSHLGFKCYEKSDVDDSGKPYPILKLKLK